MAVYRHLRRLTYFSLPPRIVRRITPLSLGGSVKPFIIDCADTRIIRTPSRQELHYTRSKIVAAARAFGLNAIDMVGRYPTLRVRVEPGPVGLGLC